MLGAPAGAVEHSAECQTVFDEAIILTHIEDLNYDAIDLYRSAGAKVAKDDSFSLGERYWMNHCENCGAKIGDHYLQKPGLAFFPTTEEEMAGVTLTIFATALQASCSVSVGIAQRLVDFHLGGETQ